MGLLKKYNEEDFRNKVRSSNHAIHEKYDELNNTPQSKFDDQADKQLTRMQHIEQTIDLRLQEIQLMGDFLPWENRPEENDEKNYSENQ